MVGIFVRMRSLICMIERSSKNGKKYDQERPDKSSQRASVNNDCNDTKHDSYYDFLQFKYQLELLHTHVEQAQLYITRKLEARKENDEDDPEDYDYHDLLEYKYQLDLLLTQVEQGQLVVERKINAHKDKYVDDHFAIDQRFD